MFLVGARDPGRPRARARARGGGAGGRRARAAGVRGPSRARRAARRRERRPTTVYSIYIIKFNMPLDNDILELVFFQAPIFSTMYDRQITRRSSATHTQLRYSIQPRSTARSPTACAQQ